MMSIVKLFWGTLPGRWQPFDEMVTKIIAKKIAGWMPKWFPVRSTRRLLQSFSPNREKGRYKKLSILQEPIYQCVLFSAETEAQRLQERLPNCSFQRSNPYSVDIVPKMGRSIMEFWNL